MKNNTLDTFDGFTLPEGAYIPVELIYLLPLLSGAQLKIVLTIAFAELSTPGKPLSFTDLEKLTGLKRPTVNTAVASLDGVLIYRSDENGGLVYRLVKKFNHLVKIVNRKVESNVNKNFLTDSLNLTKLVKLLCSAGVFLATAQALVVEYPADHIEEHLSYFQYAIDKGLAKSPGYLVRSIRERWGPPLGYSKPITDEERRHSYAQWDSNK